MHWIQCPGSLSISIVNNVFLKMKQNLRNTVWVSSMVKNETSSHSHMFIISSEISKELKKSLSHFWNWFFAFYVWGKIQFRQNIPNSVKKQKKANATQILVRCWTNRCYRNWNKFFAIAIMKQVYETSFQLFFSSFLLYAISSIYLCTRNWMKFMQKSMKAIFYLIKRILLREQQQQQQQKKRRNNALWTQTDFFVSFTLFIHLF